MWTADSITRGDFVVINDKNLFIGKVLTFQKSSEKTKKAKGFYHDSQVLVLLDLLYLIQKDKTKLIVAETHKYFSQKVYICHLKNEKVDFRNQNVKNLLKRLILKKKL